MAESLGIAPISIFSYDKTSCCLNIVLTKYKVCVLNNISCNIAMHPFTMLNWIPQLFHRWPFPKKPELGFRSLRTEDRRTIPTRWPCTDTVIHHVQLSTVATLPPRESRSIAATRGQRRSVRGKWKLASVQGDRVLAAYSTRTCLGTRQRARTPQASVDGPSGMGARGAWSMVQHPILGHWVPGSKPGVFKSDFHPW